MTWMLAIGSVVAVSAVSLAGVVTLWLTGRHLHRLTSVLVSFAVGTLLGDTFLHLIPEALESGAPLSTTSALTLAGLLGFFVLEKVLRYERGPLRRHRMRGAPELAAINLIGDALHNLIDGVLIAASYLVSPALGLSTTLAVAAHELPQELGDFGILVHSGLRPRKALLLNLASASLAIVGTVATLLAGDLLGAIVPTVLVPITAGGFLYIAAAALIPELQRERSARAFAMQAASIALGVALMAALTAME